VQIALSLGDVESMAQRPHAARACYSNALDLSRALGYQDGEDEAAAKLTSL
jgi:hypothetical protein